jgi:ferric-dicitrate binding protein FerR (iron transport regulator)
MRLQDGDILQSTDASAGAGEALVQLDDGARLALRYGSAFEVKQLPSKGAVAAGQTTVRVVKGGLRYISGKVKGGKVAFETKTATIGVRGTDIEIVVTEEAVQGNNPGTYLKVNTGAAFLTAPDGAQVEVTPGEVAYGGEPDVTSRGIGGTRRAAARKVQIAKDAGLFKASSLDRLMRSK